MAAALRAHPDLGFSGSEPLQGKFKLSTWEEHKSILDAEFAALCPRDGPRPKAVGLKWMTNQGHE